MIDHILLPTYHGKCCTDHSVFIQNVAKAQAEIERLEAEAANVTANGATSGASSNKTQTNGGAEQTNGTEEVAQELEKAQIGETAPSA